MYRALATLAIGLTVLAGVAPTSVSAAPLVPPTPIKGWPSSASMVRLDCPGTNVCFAVGDSVTPHLGVIARTEDGGASWKFHTDAGAMFNSIACPGPAQCYVITGRNRGHAVSYALTVTQNGGKTWQQHPLPAGTNPSELACPAVTTCVLWGYALPRTSKAAMLITTNGARTWKASAAVGRVPCCTAASLACPTIRVCYAYGGFGGSTAILRSPDGGAHWTTLPGTNLPARSGVPPRSLVNAGEIACPTARVCYTVQGDLNVPYGTIFGTRDGGKHWGELYRAHGRDYPLGEITCPSTNVCYAVGATQPATPGNQIVFSKDGGRTWSTHTLFVAPLFTCPGITTCYAANDAGAVSRSTDGGATWRSLP